MKAYMRRLPSSIKPAMLAATLVTAAAVGSSCPAIWDSKQWIPDGIEGGHQSTPGPTTLVLGGVGECCDTANDKPFFVKALGNGSSECTVFSSSWWDPDFFPSWGTYYYLDQKYGQSYFANGSFYFANNSIAHALNYYLDTTGQTFFDDDDGERYYQMNPLASPIIHDCPANHPHAVSNAAPVNPPLNSTWERSHQDCCFYATMYNSTYYTVEEDAPSPPDPWHRVRCTYYDGTITAGNSTLHVLDASMDLGSFDAISLEVVGHFHAADSNGDNAVTHPELEVVCTPGGGASAATENAARTMSAGDANTDGMLTLEEFNDVYDVHVSCLDGAAGDDTPNGWMISTFFILLVFVVGLLAALWKCTRDSNTGKDEAGENSLMG